MRLYPNCSETTVRIKSSTLSPERKAKFLKQLNALHYEDDKDMKFEMNVSEEKIFGVDCIVISGDAPYNNREEIDEVIAKYSEIKDDDIEEEEQ